MSMLISLGMRAKEAARSLNTATTAQKNAALMSIADGLMEKAGEITEQNEADLKRGRKNGMAPAMLDRLTLTRERIAGICEGVRQVAALDDPIGEVLSMKKRPNGLLIGQKRVPLGVIGIIYESRPNVTVDCAALCLKTANAVILRGGSEAIFSNRALVKIMREAVESAGITPDAIGFVDSVDRADAAEMMRLNKYIDVLIPRGGAGLISAVVENATVPVIETGTGNCHIFVDSSADLQMAASILYNAKTSRPSVCNAAESLLVCADVAREFLPIAYERLRDKNVEFRGCEVTLSILPGAVPASEEDYGAEFLDYILSCKVVEGIDEAIDHIARFGTGHSECIVTKSYDNAQKFLDGVDSAAVYVNASTRFTDGFEFGMGAEIGISTQKMHARGPMGLKELCSTKFIIYGDGQIR